MFQPSATRKPWYNIGDTLLHNGKEYYIVDICPTVYEDSGALYQIVETKYKAQMDANPRLLADNKSFRKHHARMLFDVEISGATVKRGVYAQEGVA